MWNWPNHPKFVTNVLERPFKQCNWFALSEKTSETSVWFIKQMSVLEYDKIAKLQ